MAKGQQRSNREVKKPKKNAGAKAKPGAASSFAQLPKAGSNPPSRKP
jgi:hypothetical protein